MSFMRKENSLTKDGTGWVGRWPLVSHGDGGDRRRLDGWTLGSWRRQGQEEDQGPPEETQRTRVGLSAKEMKEGPPRSQKRGTLRFQGPEVTIGRGSRWQGTGG